MGLFKHWDEDPNPEDNRLVKAMHKRIAMTDEFHGSKTFIKINGKRLATPMFTVMIAIASTDLLFALDSIPAILGLTTSTYVVITANIFALMGLRQLYFLLQGAMNRLIHLGRGLSFILAFIGVKMIMHALHENGVKVPDISLEVSLTVIVSALAITALTSLYATRDLEKSGRE